jgi:putative SOS response-associated peptidase YedK
MCGRFTLKTPAADLAEVFDVPEPPTLPFRYNVAPTQSVPVVRTVPGGQGRELVSLRWGLIPSWAQDPSIGNRLINARADTASIKPSFRSAFKQRRCLVLADGFYEWQKQGSKKQPYYFQLRTGGPFAFAGLWEHWQGGEEIIESCTLLTTEANDVVRPVHDRMPVILAPDAYEQWLDPRVQKPDLQQALLRPYPGEAMTAYPVGTRVNNPRNDDRVCVQTAEPLA